MNFKDLSIKMKLILSFGIVLLFSGIASFSGLNTINKMKNTINEIFSVTIPSITLLLHIDRDLQQLVVAERSMIYVNVASDSFKNLEKDYEENLTQTKERWDKFKSLLNGRYSASIATYENEREVWQKFSRQIVNGRKSDTREGRTLAIDLSMKEGAQSFEKMRGQINDLQDLLEKEIELKKKEIASDIRKSFLSVLFLIILSFAVAFFSVKLMLKYVVGSIVSVLNMLQNISRGEGDLTKRIIVDTKDESGQLGLLLIILLKKLS